MILAILLTLAAPAQASADAKLSPADRLAAMKTTGMTMRGGQWQSGCDDSGSPAYSPGMIEQVADLNGDGRPEVIVSEGSSMCYGMTGMGYWLVSKQANGSWKLMARGTGILAPLKTRGAANWPDLEIGGPGFCFPVHRFNGTAYVLHRQEYEGKPCRR